MKPKCNAKYPSPYHGQYHWCSKEEVVYSDGANNYCIYHAPKGYKFLQLGKDEKISKEDFDNRVHQRIAEHAEKGEFCDLSGTIFEWGFQGSSLLHQRELNNISFAFAEFHGLAIFRGSKLTNLDFLHAKFFGSADFGACDIIKPWFWFTEFGNTVDFHRATFRDKTYFRDIRFIHGEADFKVLDVQDSIVFVDCDMTKAAFLGTDIRRVNFVNCSFETRDNRYVLYDEMPPKHKKLSPEDLLKRTRAVEGLYRAQKQKCSENHNQYDYSFWHASEKEMLRQRTPWSSPMRWFLSPYRFFSGYGEDPIRAGVIGLIIIALSIMLMGWSGVIYQPEFGCKMFLNYTDIFGKVARYVLETLAFMKPDGFTPMRESGYWIMFFSRIIVTLQFTFFAFALRNRLRR